MTREQWDTDYWIMSQSNLGRLLPTVGRPEEAVVVLETILERYPDNAEARSSLALALAQAGQGATLLASSTRFLRVKTLPLSITSTWVCQCTGLMKWTGPSSPSRRRSHDPPCTGMQFRNLAQTLNLLEDYEAQVPHSEKLVELDPFQRLRPTDAYKGVGPGRAGTGCCRRARGHAGPTVRDQQPPAPAVSYRLQHYGRGP